MLRRFCSNFFKNKVLNKRLSVFTSIFIFCVLSLHDFKKVFVYTSILQKTMTYSRFSAFRTEDGLKP